jgi:hypothetical protein
MKKSLFFKSGISLLMLAGVGAASASEASFEGGMYNDLQALQVSGEWTTPSTAVRGAQGPIRSVDVPRVEGGDMYSDLQALQVSAEWTTPTTAVRGAQGPIRSVEVSRIEGDMYEYISRFQSVQKSDKSTSERGAQGPVRDDAFMSIP